MAMGSGYIICRVGNVLPYCITEYGTLKEQLMENTGNLPDITTHEDIEFLVNGFYQRIRGNELLSPIFNGIIKDEWQTHLDKMYSFWGSLLLQANTYNGSPFPRHAKLPVTKKHFDTWLSLWNAEVDLHFRGEKATEAKWRADKMATMFNSKIEYYQNNPAIPFL